MSTSIGYATVQIVPSMEGFNKSVSKELDGTMPATGGKAGKSLGGGMLKAIGPVVTALGAAIGGAFAAKKVADFTMQASDLNETISKSEAIFKDNSAAMVRWGASAATNLGMTQEQALSAAAGFGDMFNQLGFAGGEAANMSQSVLQLAADLGSFNNLDTTEVTDMMSAAFRGEYDSLQRLIPNINAARVETEALAMTGKTNAAELTAQEKAAATLAIMQKDGAAAAGDFARTSVGLANGLKILGANVTQAGTAIGNIFMPFGAAAVSMLNGVMTPLSDATGALTLFGQNAMGAFGDAYAASGDLGVGITAMSAAITRDLPGLSQTITDAILGMVTAIVEMVPVLSETLIPTLVGAINGLIPPMLSALAAAIPLVVQAGSALFGGLLQSFIVILPELLAGLGLLVGQIGAALISNIPLIVEAGATLLIGLVEAVGIALPLIIGALAGMVPSLVETICAMLPQLLEAGLQAFMGIVQAVGQNLPRIITALVNCVPSLVQTIVAMLPQLLSAMLQALMGLIRAVDQILPPLLTAVVALTPEIVGELVAMAPQLLRAMFTACGALVDAVGRAIPLVLGAAGDLIRDLIAKFREIDLGGIARDMIQGFINGIRNMAGRVITTIKNTITNALPDFVKKALGIHSPSRVFRALGENVGEGMALGIASTAGDVQKAADGLVPALPKVRAYGRPNVATGGLSGALATSSGQPSTLVVVDQDGSLIGRMRVEAGRVQAGYVSPLDYGKATW